jgi:hypothetical protein
MGNKLNLRVELAILYHSRKSIITFPFLPTFVSGAEEDPSAKLAKVEVLHKAWYYAQFARHGISYATSLWCTTSNVYYLFPPVYLHQFNIVFPFCSLYTSY